MSEREEWSSAVVRAATVTEIAVNLVVRKELSLEKELVDHFLRWANGIMGKFDKLILPVTKGKAQHGAFKDLKKYVRKINEQRNSVVHQGQFKKRDTAIKVVTDARTVMVGLVSHYHEDFDLETIE